MQEMKPIKIKAKSFGFDDGEDCVGVAKEVRFSVRLW